VGFSPPLVSGGLKPTLQGTVLQFWARGAPRNTADTIGGFIGGDYRTATAQEFSFGAVQKARALYSD